MVIGTNITRKSVSLRLIKNGRRTSYCDGKRYIYLIITISWLVYSFSDKSYEDFSNNNNLKTPAKTTTPSSNAAAATTMQQQLLPALLQPLPGDQYLFGFFFQVHKHPKATLEVMRDLYNVMPQYPVYMISSGGYHYNNTNSLFPNVVHYRYEDANANIKRGRDLPLWFERVKGVAEMCNCSYLVFLEDDVRVLQQRPLMRKPPHDAGGVPSHIWTNHWFNAGQEHLEETLNTSIAQWSYNNSGLCGGSYVRTEAFLDAFEHAPWDAIYSLNTVVGRYNDVTLAVILMIRGYIVKPWEEVQELGRNSTPDGFTFLHGDKQWYSTALEGDERRFIEETSEDPCALQPCRNQRGQKERKR